ncbi:MAG: hypothetical protein COU83_00915 [Candidatus Portnoybacteria bacterium CG10_big_fil_rev_8_21_14_0_10_40_22]|uniref:Uncharacterized protein n=1 Tax=Candidatus Portnoybacteria bacterium CG10_big_fil_rev_8_21_14_0_10_40_22 TaxID=1974814 RepID=A0A2M8KGB5_9BACT|nr:MAG: hypothetical protein COU83_00915 [Candidatus Portnoybacteria bacterium CG10_big_fil_rev_8_21_14_0_10_40_22]
MGLNTHWNFCFCFNFGNSYIFLKFFGAKSFFACMLGRIATNKLIYIFRKSNFSEKTFPKTLKITGSFPIKLSTNFVKNLSNDDIIKKIRPNNIEIRCLNQWR